ncbi:hypothetical protein XENOCAPTIV_017228, partial [Xenoophorus captivus]
LSDITPFITHCSKPSTRYIKWLSNPTSRRETGLETSSVGCGIRLNCGIMSLIVDLLLMLIDVTYSILCAVVRTFLHPRLKSIDGELCLITGAGGVLGRLFALEFAKEGAHLILWDCNTAANEQTAQLARKLGVEVRTYTVDLSKRQSIYEAAGRVRAEVGDVSILVNNAGVVAGQRLLECPDELLERTLLVNCHALKEIQSLIPPLEPLYTAQQSMKAILGEQEMVCIPRIMYIPFIARA